MHGYRANLKDLSRKEPLTIAIGFWNPDVKLATRDVNALNGDNRYTIILEEADIAPYAFRYRDNNDEQVNSITLYVPVDGRTSAKVEADRYLRFCGVDGYLKSITPMESQTT